MSNILFNTKEDIRSRMLRNAMDYWGTSNANDMDPMVKLLIEALSTELFNISNDVKNLETRVLNKISRILASDYLTSALPAHAILRAQPIESREALTVDSHFFYRQPAAKENGQAEQADMFFSPAGGVSLFNAAIRYICSGNNVFEYDEHLHKNTVLHTTQSGITDGRSLWLGIDCAEQLTDINNLSLFIEWPDYGANEDFYKLLSVVKCYLHNEEVQSRPGFIYQEDLAQDIRPVFYEQNIINLIIRDIKAYYDSRFISLTDERLQNIGTQKRSLPDELIPFFNNSEMNRLRPCVWIKLSFPAAIPASVIDDLQIAINCFPVVNRRLHEKKYRLRELNNVIPVKPENKDHFLSVKEVYDDRNTYYAEIPYAQAGKSYDGSYSIRNGGAERFDSRDAQQIIQYLFELLRDEKAAFTSYGTDYLTGILRTLEQNLSLIERKVQHAHHSPEPFNYLIVNPPAQAAMLYVHYWTTLADAANHIRRGSRLQQFEMFKLRADTLRLMTGTIGGRNSLGATERIQAYKYGLTTKDRIVTQADLISFCYYELGNKITNVRTAKGVAVSSNPKEGFKKTIDIFLKPDDTLKLDRQDWDTLLALLLSKLESRSVMNASYRVFMEG
ncbi:type VI secretion system baseplate subunit TssF [Mucilaginibacter sp. Bleaf8]|uniref:type VI secretion system baseplate subunit TssF n=1 Tax=Mucilaginibacter sp. Bleaf8 TaxID=2834430 RepID=UPI001BD03E19|nr:type VI secretion system baseplate subunit TssF [Mucilaginibacter sp. Bleaf8]MBS7566721.1 type VI secretion system baseplate subunit TssF [Mucilaginibacter sp. Bleaf8]